MHYVAQSLIASKEAELAEAQKKEAPEAIKRIERELQELKDKYEVKS